VQPEDKVKAGDVTSITTTVPGKVPEQVRVILLVKVTVGLVTFQVPFD